MCYFYGFRPCEVEALEMNEFNYLWESISMIEAQEQLKAFEVNEWHVLSNDQRKTKHRKLFNVAYPNLEKKNNITFDDLARLLAGG